MENMYLSDNTFIPLNEGFRMFLWQREWFLTSLKIWNLDRFTQNPVVTLSYKFAHKLELVTSGADKTKQPNYNNIFLLF